MGTRDISLFLIRLSVVGVTALLSYRSLATTLYRPNPIFEKMVERASLIAIVEVTEGGAYTFWGKVLQALKGSDPATEMKISGHNLYLGTGNIGFGSAPSPNPLNKGDRLLLFRHKEPPFQTWHTLFPINDGKIRGGWLVVNPNERGPSADADMVLQLVRGYIQLTGGQPPHDARALLAARLSIPFVEKVSRAQTPENLQRAWTLQWLLCAQGAYGDARNSNAVLTATRSPNDLVRICAARALPSIGATPAVFDAAAALVTDKHSRVQAEGCTALLKTGFPRDQIVPLLIKALPRSSQASMASSAYDGLSGRGREKIIRTLTDFNVGEEAELELVKLIPSVLQNISGESHLDWRLFGALASHFLKNPSASARKAFLATYSRVSDLYIDEFHDYFFEDGSDEYLTAIRSRLRVQGARFGDLRGLRRLPDHLPDGDPRYEELVFNLLRKYNGTMEASDVLPAAVPAASQRIQTLLESYQTNSLREADTSITEVNGTERWMRIFTLSKQAVAAKLNPSPDANTRLAFWINILREDLSSGYFTEHALREINRSTPPALRHQAVSEIRRLGTRHSRREILSAIKNLGGTLTPEENDYLARGSRR
jgi:hypothetical protein